MNEIPNEVLTNQVINIINYNAGISLGKLITLLEANPDYKPNQILHAISEACQDNKIKRIEYQLPGATTWYSIYFPFGTKFG